LLRGFGGTQNATNAFERGRGGGRGMKNKKMPARRVGEEGIRTEKARRGKVVRGKKMISREGPFLRIGPKKIHWGIRRALWELRGGELKNR